MATEVGLIPEDAPSKRAGKNATAVTKVSVSAAPSDAAGGPNNTGAVIIGAAGTPLEGQQVEAANEAFLAWLKNEPRWPRRATLPPPAQPTPTDMNVWALIKDFVYKGELSKIATPVQFLEPLSELQQRCEDMEYCELLDQAAATEPQSLERLLLVTAFSMSAYSGVKRTKKPVNAFLGETFEYACPEKGFRFLAEKVQHEPTTINHVHAEGHGWVFNLEDELHTRFTGTAIELMPIVLIQVAFIDGDTYRWHKAVTSINGVLLNNIKLDHKGAYTVQGVQSGYTAKMKLHATGLLTSKAKMHEVSGTVEKDGAAVKGLSFKGKWDVELVADLPDGSSRRLWEKNPPAADPSRFDMSPWVMTLNEISPELQKQLPATDTRLRPDIRCLEEGVYDQAAKEHRRLLEEHEARIKRLAQNKEVFQPRWCERNPEPNLQIGKQYLFRYKQGTYWEEREARSRA